MDRDDFVAVFTELGFTLSHASEGTKVVEDSVYWKGRPLAVIGDSTAGWYLRVYEGDRTYTMRLRSLMRIVYRKDESKLMFDFGTIKGAMTIDLERKDWK